MKSCDLTIGVTAHNEGILAHKTMLSIFEAAKLLDQHKITYEILVHIDNGDKLTKDCFKSFNDPHLRIIEGNFGDAGPSRNNLAKNAKGKYVSFLDADDLISSNWYYDAYQKLSTTKEKIIVHPEYNLTFGTDVKQQVMWRQSDSIDRPTDLFLAVGVNRWTSCAAAKREIFLDAPYPAAGDGYGNEDYWFNTDLLDKGVKHLVITNAIQFYRQRKTSRFAGASSESLIQPYAPALSIKDFQKLSLSDVKLQIIRPDLVGEKQQKSNLSVPYRLGKKAYNFAKKKKVLDLTLTPFANSIVNLSRYFHEKGASYGVQNLGYELPEQVLSEWRSINQIENQLYPTKGSLRGLVGYRSEGQVEVGLAYHDLIKNISKLPEVVFIVPWVSTGGADKLLINYLNGIKELHPDWRVAVITTTDDPNVWADRLPDNTDLINFGKYTKSLSYETDQDQLFSRLITQLQCKNLHIINSEFGYKWAEQHSDLISKHYQLDISLFGRAPIKEEHGEIFFDYADPYAVSIYPLIHKIYTDNTSTVSRCVEKSGFSKDKFVVEYQALDDEILPPHQISSGGKIKILWASRVATPKNPELLKEIAKSLDPSRYQIDMYGLMSDDYTKQEFTAIPTINYKGGFDGIASLDTSQYDIFLYTSLADGLPNILLEIAARGIPIIASNVGGIGDFIKNGDTGILIDDYNNPAAYISTIKDCESNPKLAAEYATRAGELLTKQHSPAAYRKTIAKHFGGIDAK